MHKSCIRCLLVATAISAGSLSLAAAPSALSSRAFGDDTKKEKKEEDKYTKFFKDKKVETARGSSARVPSAARAKRHGDRRWSWVPS